MAHRRIISTNDEIYKNFKSLKTERLLRKISKSRSVSPAKNNEHPFDIQFKQCEQKIEMLGGEWAKLKTSFNASNPPSQLANKPHHITHKRNMTSIADCMHKNSTDGKDSNGKLYSPLKTDIIKKQKPAHKKIVLSKLCNRSELASERLTNTNGSCTNRDEHTSIIYIDEPNCENEDAFDNEPSEINKVFTSIPFRNILAFTSRPEHNDRINTKAKIPKPGSIYKVPSIFLDFSKRNGFSSIESSKLKMNSYRERTEKSAECDIPEENESSQISLQVRLMNKHKIVIHQNIAYLNESAYSKDAHHNYSLPVKKIEPLKLISYNDNYLAEAPCIKCITKSNVKPRQERKDSRNVSKILHKLKSSGSHLNKHVL